MSFPIYELEVLIPAIIIAGLFFGVFIWQFGLVDFLGLQEYYFVYNRFCYLNGGGAFQSELLPPKQWCSYDHRQGGIKEVECFNFKCKLLEKN